MRATRLSFLSLTILIGLSLFLTFCAAGCSVSGDPEAVVVEFFEALYEKDYGSAIVHYSDRCLDQVTAGGENAFTKIREDHSSGGNIYTESKVVSNEHGDNTCEVYSEDNEDLRIWLIRQNGKWAIDEFEFRRATRDAGGDGDDGGDEENK